MSSDTLLQGRPKFFRLPKQALPARKPIHGGAVKPARPPETDPYFGFTRSFYYQGEERGFWRLVRIRPPGKKRGITLVNYNEVENFLRKQAGNAG
jgi:hypothetical protein